MALSKSALSDLLDALRAGGDLDAHRNGSRARLLSTKAGDVELRIPKLREGSFFPVLLEPRLRIDRALLAVVMEAYVHGISTRKVDDLARADSKKEISSMAMGSGSSSGAK
jgi:putative transposase